MRNGLFTVTLAVALTACSKPNPLFFDTWEGLSEGATLVDTGQTASEPGTTATDTDGPTTTDPTTTTTTEPATTTTTTSPTETSEPQTSGSTGGGCVSKPMQPLAPADDTFIVNIGTVGPACTLAGQDEEFLGDPCDDVEFGKQPILSVFNRFVQPTQEFGVYILDFPRDGQGRLLYGNVPLEPDTIETVTLQLAFSNTFKKQYEAASVSLYAIPATFLDKPAEWYEGPGEGARCDDGANVRCTTCKATPLPNPPACLSTWWGQDRFDIGQEMLIFIGSYTLEQPGEVGKTALLDLGIDGPAFFGQKDIIGFAVVLDELTIGGQPAEAAPGFLRVHSKEHANPELRPALLVEACL